MNDVIIIDGKACNVLWTQEGSETWDKSGNVTQFDLKCYVIGNVSKRSAMQAVWENSPDSYENLPRYNIKFDGYDEDKNAEFTVSYQKSTSSGSRQQTNDDALDISFSTGGGTKHITIPYWQKVLYQADGENYSNNTPIGWNGKKGEESEAAGVDVLDANIQFTLTAKRKMSDLDTNWQRNMAKVTGKINSKPFHGWEKGEVLFEGVSLSGKEDDENVSVSFNFSVRCNEKNVAVAWDDDGKPISLNKEGFAYVWTITKYDEKKEKNSLRGLFGARVFEHADFSILGV